MTRSEVMARVRDTNTRPEMAVRRALWTAGLRFRLHSRALPGHPDLVFTSRRLVVFVHGCFWHGHEGCSRHRIPKSRTEWWTAKITRNMERDAEVRDKLSTLGWTIFVVWECQTEKAADLAALITRVAAWPANAPPS
jgi:DNA mismatch endonuclease (patch repair protein)